MAPHAETEVSPLTASNKLPTCSKYSEPDGNVGLKPSNQSPFSLISSLISFREPAHQFWWSKTGSQLATLLDHASYPKSAQYTELLFYALHIVPELGPAPESNGYLRWRSPQTPDGTPLDLSWEWGTDGKGVIRTSFEPIGPLAGTSTDPFNRYETDVWIQHLNEQGLVEGLDLQWYKHFTATVLPSELERVQLSEKLLFELAPVAGTFVTRDIDLRTGPIIKMYIFPGLRAQELGISNLDVVERAVRSLPADQIQSLNAEPMLQYLHDAAAKWGMEVGIFSFDLVAAEKSRIKIYTRAPNTSIAYLMDALTLGGRVDLSSYSPQVLRDVQDFWRIFIGEDTPEVLEKRDKERAGPGFYFTVKKGALVTPKVYISPAAFCANDKEVVERLRLYWETRTGDDDTEKEKELMLRQMGEYEKAMEEIYGSEFLGSQCDIHFYVSCALQKNRLRVVTYLCPQTLAREAEARKQRL